MSLLDHNEPWSEAEALNDPLRISDDGLALIKEFEGYHKRQPDGSCVAYLCPANVPTIGWGSTKGVTLGMRWTVEEATAGLRRELEQCERDVLRLVTVPLNQNQFDALVSFCYNCGPGNLKRSTLLRKLNRGDYDGAEAQFYNWTRGGGRVLRGLVRRRKREAELFGRPMVPAEADMPQAVSEDKGTGKKLAVAAGVAAPPAAVAAANTPPSTWDAGMMMLGKMGAYASSNWQTVAAIGGISVLLMVIPKFVRGDDE